MPLPLIDTDALRIEGGVAGAGAAVLLLDVIASKLSPAMRETSRARLHATLSTVTLAPALDSDGVRKLGPALTSQREYHENPLWTILWANKASHDAW